MSSITCAIPHPATKYTGVDFRTSRYTPAHHAVLFGNMEITSSISLVVYDLKLLILRRL